MNWLIWTHWKARLSPSVLWLAGRYIDGYIQRCDANHIGPSLCLGATSLYLAIKLEENNRLRAFCRLGHIADISKGTYTPEDVIAMEQRLIKIFDGMLSIPTVYDFIVHYLSQLEASGVPIDLGIEQLSAYYAESTLLSTYFSKLKASQVGAAVLYAALMCRDQHSYGPLATETFVKSLQSSPATITATRSPFPSPQEDVPTRGIANQIASALRWQPSKCFSPAVMPHTLWLPQLCQVTGLTPSALNEDSKRIVSRLVHPEDFQQTRSVSFEKYSSRKRLSVCHLRHPIFPEEISDTAAAAPVMPPGPEFSTPRRR